MQHSDHATPPQSMQEHDGQHKHYISSDAHHEPHEHRAGHMGHGSHSTAMFQELGLRVAMLTGDSQAVADWVAAELGLDEVFAQVLPADKSEKIRALQHSGNLVAMVGDGINDAPALAAAEDGLCSSS